MIIGYEICGKNDTDSNMFDSDDINLPICSKCGYITNFDYISPLFRLNRHNYDIAYTCDLREIVSLKFKEFCIRNKYKGIEFIELPNDHNFFKLKVKNLLKFDTDKAKLEYDKYCDKCKNYESITPAHPILLKGIDKELDDGFYVTDIHFASGNEKTPIFIVGVETYEKMKKEKFKGIFFSKIEIKD